jgi:cobalt/nickel transport system ATP-binding protein
MSTTLLTCKNLTYSYLSKFPALDDVSISVIKGEKLALLGANGSGKSSLLKLLDGLIFPQSGSYEAFGKLVTEDNLEEETFSHEFRSRIGFVFQNSDAQVFSPTVREEVAFGPLQLAIPNEEVHQRVDETLELLGISNLADRPPFQLSGGQKKRVAIASILIMNPEIFLFDEPTAGLDPRTQEWLFQLIEELSRRGKTIVTATHELSYLNRIADRCLVFGENHKIVSECTPSDLLSNRKLLMDVNLIHPDTNLHFHSRESY